MASFYRLQEDARSKTRWLVALFILAVICITLAVNVVVCFALMLEQSQSDLDWPGGLNAWFSGPAFVYTSFGTLAVIMIGSLNRTLRLGSNGQRVATMMGGTRIMPGKCAPQERVLINVVEEMAIASGIKVPAVYVLKDESGINAFAAGLTPREAAIAVTQGALEHFSRDELQGVVAHEFSHILNGDMRLNLRLIGVLAGILTIGQIGEHLMTTRSRRSSDRNGAVIVGLAIYLVGAIGLFFGQLIKAGISRQREFLADASAVQFTRLPEGIGAALLRIQQHTGGSRLNSSHAEDVSHMCFGESHSSLLGRWLATHPPLDERIRAVAPGVLSKHYTLPPSPETNGEARRHHASAVEPASASLAGFAPATDPVVVKASVGTLDAQAIEAGSHLHRELPPELLESAHDPAEAGFLLCALLLSTPQRNAPADASIPARITELARVLVNGPPAWRLALSDILLPVLEAEPEDVRLRWLAELKRLMALDGTCSMSECANFLLAERSLHPSTRDRRQISSLASVREEIHIIMRALAVSSGHAEAERTRLLAPHLKGFGITPDAPMPTLDIRKIGAAMQTLTRLSPLLKQVVIDSAIDLVMSDAKVTLHEFEMLRAFAGMLECPIPLHVTERAA